MKYVRILLYKIFNILIVSSEYTNLQNISEISSMASFNLLTNWKPQNIQATQNHVHLQSIIFHP